MSIEDWRQWSKRYVPRRRTWRIGDRFQVNDIPEPLVFEITGMTPKVITFWAPYYDRADQRIGKSARHYERRQFLEEVRRRKLVRVS